MLTIRYWTDSKHAGGVSPFGDHTRVLTRPAASERVMRSVGTWCMLNKLSFRFGICAHPQSMADQLEATLVEVQRDNDAEMVHVRYMRKPWNYMHVVHRTANPLDADRMMKYFVELGRGMGDCRNSPRDLVDPVHHPPYFVYVLTGKLAPRNRPEADSKKAAAPSLLGLADM